MSTQVAPSITTSDSLSVLLKRGASQRTIASHLDGLAPYARMQEVLAITGSSVGKLYDAVAGAEPLTIEDVIPASETGTVILEGRNSLPAFTRFQKRFARVGSGESKKVIGYNHQIVAPLTGPGFFVVQPATPSETHPDEIFFDYTSEPGNIIPAGWPTYVPNSNGMSKLVYMNMKDFCRRVAGGILVGKAYKKGVAQNAYFTLSRPY